VCVAKSSGPTIASNVFRSNKATDGGAIACTGAYAVIDGNTIGADGYPNEADRDGGGIYCREVTNTIIKNNVITWNEARGHGGGIAFYKCKLPTPRSPEKSCMHKNRITRNRASIGGGFSILNTSNWAAVWNVIAGNIAQAGAGLYVSGSTGSSAYVRALQNNTIADNSCDDPF